MKFSSQVLASILSTLLVLPPLSAQSVAPLHIQVQDSDGAAVAAGSAAVKGFTVQVTDQAGAPVSDAAVVVRMPDTGSTASFADGTHAAIVYTGANGTAHVTGFKWGSTPGASSVRITATKGTAHAGLLVEETVNAALDMQPQAAALPVAKKPSEELPQQPGKLETAKPARVPVPTSVPDDPQVSVVNGPTHQKVHSGGGGSKKWLIIALVAAGAGAGIAFAGKGKSSTAPSTPTQTTNVGNPTITVGAP